MFRPKDALLEGAKILDLVLLPKGFQFQLREKGRGSGGNFAWGEFVREDRLHNALTSLRDGDISPTPLNRADSPED